MPANDVLVVNMIPRSLSGERHQDSEPTLAVNPKNTQQIVGTAFTPDPLGGDMAPVYVSSDGGHTWTLSFIVPSRTETQDICVGFSAETGRLYAGILRLPPPGPDETRLNILRTKDPLGSAPMQVLVDRRHVDQPFVQVVTINSGSKKKDRLYVGDNDFADAAGRTSTIDYSLNASAAKARFKKARIETRPNDQQNGPQVRPACHADGTVYLAYPGWRQQAGDWEANTLVVTADIVVVRDDHGGSGKRPFTALKDSDGLAGKRVARGVSFPFHSTGSGVPGQQRLGGDVAIAVDPTDSGTVYLAWADNQPSTGYTLHLRRSTDRGVTWSGSDLVSAAHGVNPALAVNGDGVAGFLYQQLTGSGSARRWVTHFRSSSDGGASWSDRVLSTAPADTPPLQFSPYLGDYEQLLAVGKDFYGIFSASNAPDHAHFPSGVVYQRNADFAAKRLLDVDGATPVAVSIDPFFFRVTG